MRRIRVIIERIEPRKADGPEVTTRLGAMTVGVPNHHPAARCPEPGPDGEPKTTKVATALNAAADIVAGS